MKTALKLLLVFIEYNDNNSLLVMAAVTAVDRAKSEYSPGFQPMPPFFFYPAYYYSNPFCLEQPDWTALMKVIAEKDCPDPETIVYGLTVINKALHGIPDRVGTFQLAVDL